MAICPIGFTTSGQTSRRGLREPVAADDDLDVSRGSCGVEHFHRLRWYMGNGIGICYDEPLGTVDDAMAEEKGDGRLTSTVYLVRGRLGNTLHVAPVSYTSHVQHVSQCRAASMAAPKPDVVSFHWRYPQKDQLPSTCSYRLTERPRRHGVMIFVQRPASITYSR